VAEAELVQDHQVVTQEISQERQAPQIVVEGGRAGRPMVAAAQAVLVLQLFDTMVFREQ
jgi:arginine decarboxylase-like protein